jgi:hypothetical protein
MEKRSLLIVLGGDQSKIPPESCKHPLTIFCRIEMDYRLACRSKLVVGILSDLIVKPDISIFRTCGKTAVACGANCGELWLSTILFHTSDSIPSSGVNFEDGIVTDRLKGFEVGCLC